MSRGAPAVVKLRRALTATPLARRHERETGERAARPAKRSEGSPPRIKARQTPPIPFAAFEARSYPDAALALALDMQSALAVGEYLAVDLFAKLAAALALAGAPLDVVAAATRVPTDEIRHAELALRMAETLAGRPITLDVPRDRHAHLGGALSQEELDIAMVEMPAIGETLACALLGEARERARDPVLRALFSALVRDEVHHARLGWYYLVWRAPQWSQAERQRVADRVGRFVYHVDSMFSRGRDAPRGAGQAARALGVLDTKTQRAVIRRVMEDEIVPGLDGLGLGASHAWRARPRTSG
ncbi:MAG TPA: ferritin-like domain-containing protein [Polyangiaceae bacterium]|nr:ferritin-like domain-containing protein [Polyangiaceae bacterium]